MSTEYEHLHVLLADDNMVSRELVSIFLGERGFQVQLARDGTEALRLARGRSFDLVILDLRMPGLDGFATARQIRTDDAKAGRRTPLLALTADNSPEAAEQCLDAGFDGLLIKPVSNSEFFAVLDKVLGERQAL